MATFAIFFLVPRIAGQTPDQIALRYVGRSTSPEAIQATKDRLHLEDPLPQQYGRFLSAASSPAPTSSSARRPSAARRRASATRSATTSRSRSLLVDRLPVTLSLAAGASVLWLVTGVAIGVLSALRRGTAFDRGAMSIALAGVSPADLLHRPDLARAVRVHVEALAQRGQLRGASPSNPLDWAYNLVLPWVTLAFLYAALYARLTRAGHAGDDERGLHPHGPRQGPARAHRRRQARHARLADPDPHDLRPRPGPAARRRRAHRVDVLAARHRPARRRRGVRQRPADRARRRHGRRLLRRAGQPRRRRRCTPRSTRGCGPDGPVRAGRRPRAAAPAARPGPRLPRRARPAHPLPDRRRPRQVRRRPVVHPRARPHARHRRRVRLGQERDQPRRPRPAPGHGGADLRRDLARRRGADLGDARRGAPAARPEDVDDLPGPAVVAAPLLHGRAPDRRGLPRAQRRLQGGREEARDRHARPGRHPARGRSASTTTRTSSPAACASA